LLHIVRERHQKVIHLVGMLRPALGVAILVNALAMMRPAIVSRSPLLIGCRAILLSIMPGRLIRFLPHGGA
jgi:hypothetical protein